MLFKGLMHHFSTKRENCRKNIFFRDLGNRRGLNNIPREIGDEKTAGISRKVVPGIHLGIPRQEGDTAKVHKKLYGKNRQHLRGGVKNCQF